jgi:hypothetical protein
MQNKNVHLKMAQCVLAVCLATRVSGARSCTVSEDMASTLPLNSIDIPNADRIEIANMMLVAKRWPNVEIRGIVYAGGYVKERRPEEIAERRAGALKSYLILLGVKEKNIWIDTRTIRKPDVDDKGVPTLNQIAVSLVPICEGGCERLCSDPRVTPTSRAIK